MADIRHALSRELTAWLGRETSVTAMERLSGGESSECYRFDLEAPADGVPPALVLRLMREDAAAAHECAVQRAVAAQGFPTPTVLHSGSSASAFGRPFAIMAFVAGRDPVAAGAMRRLPRVLAQTMHDLHALHVEADGGDVNAVIDALQRSTRAEIARAARWFDDKRFDRASFVLCHGDLHARNLVMENGLVTAVLDWEIATFAPREYDVARTALLLELMPGVGTLPLRPLVRLLGRRVSRQFVESYVARSPIDAALLARCQALHALRLVALVRSDDGASGVGRLWQPFERELVRAWVNATGTAL